jgi:hypothetical protein
MSPKGPDDVALADSPTDAHLAMLALLHRVVVAAATRRHEELPGLVETLQDDVVLTTGETSRSAYGWFAEQVWRYGDRRVHELFLNADRREPLPGVSAAESVLVTLLHEACHVWAQYSGIQDTSRQGRYHNRRFAEIALVVGLAVEKDPAIGHCTPTLTPWARIDYAGLLAELEQGLVLTREPQRITRGSSGTAAGGEGTGEADATGPAGTVGANKYVFASCRCEDGRRHRITIRVAQGSWRPGAICCAVCQMPFSES